MRIGGLSRRFDIGVRFPRINPGVDYIVEFSAVMRTGVLGGGLTAKLVCYPYREMLLPV